MEVTTSPPVTGDIAAVRAAITAGTQAAIAAGADRRYAFTGIWTAAIMSVSGTAPTMALAAAMEEYAGNVRGIGINAESPPLLFDADARQSSAAMVAETVIGYLEPIHDQFEDDGADAFAAILDVSFAILSEVWGPFHLRKNLAMQAAAFREGVDAPIVPLEPEVQKRREPPRAAAPQSAPVEPEIEKEVVPDFDEAEAQEVPVAENEGTSVPDEFYVRPEIREIEIIAEVSTWGAGGGTGVFGVATGIGAGDAYPEVREFSGHVHNDRTGRLTPLTACVEALRRLGPPAPAETVKIGVNADFIVSAQGLGAGLPGEEALWVDLERAAKGREIEWHLHEGGVSTDLGRRSNRLTHERATQLGKAGLS